MFGKRPAPFGPLTKLTLKQSGDEARKAAPELFSKPDSNGEIVASPDYAELSFATSIDKKSKKLDRIYAQIPKSAVPLVSQAWGKGIDTKDTIGRARTVWLDPDTGWRAILEEGFGESMDLSFDRYLPATKLLGPDKGDKLGFAPDGLLGASLEDLRTRFKDTLIEEDEATAKKNREDLNKFAGKDLDKEIGKAKPDVRLELLPTEFESYWTRVQLTWGDDGKVSRFYFKLPFEGYDPAKADLKKLLDDKFGAPTEEKEFGSTGDTIYVYHADNPHIYAKEDTISHGWDLTYEVKKL
ncbi:MAG TPA: hypothetical protein VGM90_33295 [Kofleriaceae bacterium]